MTRYWYDSEFIDSGSGRTIDLISIGIVAEDGRELYLQSVDFDEDIASDWVKEHVLRDLPICPCCGHKVNHEDAGKCRSKLCMWRTCEQIKQEVTAFIDPEKYGKPELWGWCSGYDWVALCQLYGTMMDIPDGWPYYIRDIQYLLDERGLSDDQLPKQDEQAHNALADARYIKRLHEFLHDKEIWK